MWEAAKSANARTSIDSPVRISETPVENSPPTTTKPNAEDSQNHRSLPCARVSAPEPRDLTMHRATVLAVDERKKHHGYLVLIQERLGNQVAVGKLTAGPSQDHAEASCSDDEVL